MLTSAFEEMRELTVAADFISVKSQPQTSAVIRFLRHGESRRARAAAPRCCLSRPEVVRPSRVTRNLLTAVICDLAHFPTGPCSATLHL